MTIAESLLLVATDEHKQPVGDPAVIDAALAAAHLVELGIFARITTSEDDVTVLDDTPPDDPLLRTALEQLSTAGTLKRDDASMHVGHGLREACYRSLENKGVLARLDHGWRSIDDGHETRIRAALRMALNDATAVPRTRIVGLALTMAAHGLTERPVAIKRLAAAHPLLANLAGFHPQ
ncbi:MAG: GPP34 family phosphoprotein [Actinomycetota bacterium]|nr:GPP34 family phosphoprotein [Actinomycetota bacterium]